MILVCDDHTVMLISSVELAQLPVPKGKGLTNYFVSLLLLQLIVCVCVCVCA